MKKIYMTLALSATLLMAGENSSFDSSKYEKEMTQLQNNFIKDKAENERLCKIFSEKAKLYKKTMRKDKLAKATVKNCERRIKLYCDKIITAK